MRRAHRRPSRNPAAMVFSDGVFYDPRIACSRCGTWAATAAHLPGHVDRRHRVDRPMLDVVPGTNIVSTALRDSSTVWLDLHERDPKRPLQDVVVQRPRPRALHLAGWRALDRDRPHRRDRRSLDVLLQSVSQGVVLQPAGQPVRRIDQRALSHATGRSPDFAAAPNGTAARRWRGSKRTRVDFARREYRIAIGALQSRLRRV